MSLKRKKLLKASGVAIASVFVVNAGLIVFSGPSNTGVTATETQIPHLEYFSDDTKIQLTDNLQAGPAWGAFNVDGFVHMVNDENTMFLESEVLGFAGTEQLIAHEYAHIQQKKLIASKAGGFPSYINPIMSASFFFKLVELNDALAPYAPDFDTRFEATGDHPHSMFKNIETNADCAVELYAWNERPYASYKDSNVECTVEELAAALAVQNGDWPTPEVISSYISGVETLIAVRTYAPPRAMHDISFPKDRNLTGKRKVTISEG